MIIMKWYYDENNINNINMVMMKWDEEMIIVIMKIMVCCNDNGVWKWSNIIKLLIMMNNY